MEPGLIRQARQHPDRTAILAEGARYSYRDLLRASAAAAGRWLRGAGDLGEKRVAFLLPPGFSHVATQWGIWRAGGIAVPLCTDHPPPEWEVVIRDSGADLVVVHKSLAERIRPAARECDLAVVDDASPEPDSTSVRLPSIPPSRRAMIVYTSGTTSRPKGVVSTHRNLEVQIETLVRAWGWQPQDHILHVLPLHHVHGIVNVLCCALWSGAACEMLPGFQAGEVWERFVRSPLTLFMAVPTVYSRLIAAWEAAPPRQREIWSRACSRMRLMVSGSAALPVQVLERWQQISGHRLLERYGMTEIGMALSNPLEGERRAGCVGTPLPGVEVRLVDEQGKPVGAGAPGEIQVKGPGVFGEYWRRPEETRAAFTDGWFRSGDVAVVERGSFRILGRQSVDIIKTGGYKVSALEIEEVLRTHPDIAECAVVGLPDRKWGECVAAALVPRPGRSPSPDRLRLWAKARLAVYKAPQRFLQMDSLPRNLMGKVNKRKLAGRFPINNPQSTINNSLQEVHPMAPSIKVLLLATPPPDFWEEEAMKLIAPRHQVVRFDPNQDPAPQVQGVEAVLDLGGPKDKKPLADLLAGSIKLWQLVSTGFDHFDLDYWRERQIPVANTPGGSSAVSLAECALMLMIMVSRRWPETQALLRDRVVGRPKGLELENRRLGLVGFGASAIELARRAKSCSMKISAIDIRPVSREEQEELGVDFVGGPDELDQVVAHSDYLSLHLHLNGETRHTIDARRLRLMKPSAYLINVARGGLVDQEALHAALIEKQLAGAGLDVFAEEPVDPDSPLLQLPNVVAAPHIAGQTQETAERRAAMAAENMDRVARGLDPIYRVDQ